MSRSIILTIAALEFDAEEPYLSVTPLDFHLRYLVE